MRVLIRLFFYFVSILLLAGCGSPKVWIISSAQPDKELPKKIRRIAVLDFQNVSTGIGRQLVDGRELATQLIAKLSEAGYYEMIERSAVDKITDELARGSTVYYNPETRKKIGKRLQADALIFGTVKASGLENRGKAQRRVRVQTGQYIQRPVYNQYGQLVGYRPQPVYRDKIITIDTLSREVSVYIDFRVVDVETDAILASKPVTKVIKTRIYEGEYTSYCPSLQTLATKALNEAITSFVRYISPHRLRVERYLLEGESEPAKKGYELARAGNWDMAKQYWESALKINPGDVAALNNLAVWYERSGQNNMALQYYKKALQLAPGNTDIIYNLQDFKARVYKRIKPGS